jgi:hypothetical protein
MLDATDDHENYEINQGSTGVDDDREDCMNLADRMAAMLPDDAKLGLLTLDMARKFYDLRTDLRREDR